MSTRELDFAPLPSAVAAAVESQYPGHQVLRILAVTEGPRATYYVLTIGDDKGQLKAVEYNANGDRKYETTLEP